MCGIAGFVLVQPSELSVSRLQKMTDAVAHRGPDGEGHWISEDGRCGLGHRRLSVIDLSDAGRQPMHYLGRYVVVFNGEIYNYIELKELLVKKGYAFASRTDTEVLAALYHHKKEALLDDIDGMFSFAIYDKQEQKLFAARDRFGEKPFFYAYKKGSHFLFGSELKALWAAGVSKEVDNAMLYNYLASGHVENPEHPGQTFYTQCTRLPACHYLVLDASNCTVTSCKKYWDVLFPEVDKPVSVEAAAQTFSSLFATSVKRRLRSDVPVGSSLSGGLDSSLVVCQMAAIGGDNKENRQKIFSARFKNYPKDEGHYIKTVIDKTGVDGCVTYPSGEAFIRDLNRLFYHQEEPFGSGSVYAQYKVMELAKEANVTVLLDGQGADEVLAGYHSYFLHYFTELKSKLPELYKKEFDAYRQLHRSNTVNGLLKKDLKYFIKSNIPDAVNALKWLHHHCRQQQAPFFAREFYSTFYRNDFKPRRKYTGLNDALYHSTMHGGLHELLRYADRNSMAHGREVRLPFLFHEFVAFCFSLPATMKIRNGWTKWIMRHACQDILPEAIAWRKDKIGFEPPQHIWLQQKKMQQLICDSTQALVNRNILHVGLLNKQGAGGSGYDASKSWERLMAASLLSIT